MLNSMKARRDILPPILDAAGLHNFPYTRYAEIAEVMWPDEIHPEVKEKLDGICRAFGQEPGADGAPRRRIRSRPKVKPQPDSHDDS